MQLDLNYFPTDTSYPLSASFTNLFAAGDNPVGKLVEVCLRHLIRLGESLLQPVLEEGQRPLGMRRFCPVVVEAPGFVTGGLRILVVIGEGWTVSAGGDPGQGNQSVISKHLADSLGNKGHP